MGDHLLDQRISIRSRIRITCVRMLRAAGIIRPRLSFLAKHLHESVSQRIGPIERAVASGNTEEALHRLKCLRQILEVTKP